MENDKYISLRDNYIEIQGDEKEVAKYIDDISNGKILMVLSTKSLSKTHVKLTKKNLKKYLEKAYYTISALWINK